MPKLTVRVVYEGHTVTHYAITGDGTKTITVRVGKDGIFACLTCHTIDCIHVTAAQGYAAEHVSDDDRGQRATTGEETAA